MRLSAVFPAAALYALALPFGRADAQIVWGEVTRPYREVCGPSLARYNCAPTDGPRLLLQISQRPVPGTPESPRYTAFVGRVLSQNTTVLDNSRPCGTTPAGPFRPAHYEVTDHSTLSITRRLSRNSGAGVAGNLIEALQATGLTGSVFNQASAQLTAGWRNALERTVISNGTFSTVVLHEEVLDSLRNPVAGTAMANCADYLGRNRNMRLMRAISVARVAEASNKSTVADSIVSNLTARLRTARVPETTITEVTPAFRRIVTTEVERVAAPLVSVLSVTFFRPEDGTR